MIRVNVKPPKPSVLERLARRIEPKPGEGPPKSQARLIKQMKHIDGAQAIFAERDTQSAPKPTLAVIEMKDGDVMRFYTDGSLRHAGGKVKGKKARKALKRLRRHALRVTEK